MDTTRRIFPRISFVNFRKKYPSLSPDVMRRLFSIKRLWNGDLIYISVLHFTLILDYRISPFDDMIRYD